MPKPLAVDPDIARAATLDSAFYRDPALFVQGRERIFARTWQWIGDCGVDDRGGDGPVGNGPMGNGPMGDGPMGDGNHPAGRVRDERGSVSPRVLLPGLIDEPLLLTRDACGVLHCLSNVCTHRGNILVDRACATADIRCRYHSRRFDLAGRMTFMPEFIGARDFPSAADDLPRVPFATWNGLAFAALDPAAPFDAAFDEIGARLGPVVCRPSQHVRERDRTFDIAAHWALYVDNYLEGLHIPFVHPELARTIEPGGYETELFEHGSLQIALAGDGTVAFAASDLPPGTRDFGTRIAAYYWWVFPNLMLNFYPWGLSLNVVLPLAVDRTRVMFRSYVSDPSQLDHGAGGALDLVEQQDESVVESVQRGIRSRLYRGGRYSPSMERSVHHFHRLICRYLQ